MTFKFPLLAPLLLLGASAPAVSSCMETRDSPSAADTASQDPDWKSPRANIEHQHSGNNRGGNHARAF